jgi:hypothetical protein
MIFYHLEISFSENNIGTDRSCGPSNCVKHVCAPIYSEGSFIFFLRNLKDHSLECLSSTDKASKATETAPPAIQLSGR